MGFCRPFTKDSEERDRVGDGEELSRARSASSLPSQPSVAGEEPAAIPGAQKGGRKLALVFTCDVCQTRSAKQFTERAYRRGVVIVRCPGCQSLHLIADRLGYFGDGEWDLERIAEHRGESVRTVTDADGGGVIEALSLEDLVGRDKMQELVRDSGSGSTSGSSS
jgi:protein import protein ZIM17